MSCVFCDIIKHQKKAKILFQNELVIAFLDIYPTRPGHVLIVPKTHCLRFMDLPLSEAHEMVRVSQVMLKAQTKAGLGKGAKIKINDGPDGGQDIPHVHLHLVPLKENTFLDSSLDEIFELIKKHLSIA